MTTPSEKILAQLRALKPALAAQGVTRLRVFGSVARGEAREDSDVDLIVDFVKKPDLWTFIGMKHSLEDQIGRKVDLLTDAAIHPRMRTNILSEAKDVQ